MSDMRDVVRRGYDAMGDRYSAETLASRGPGSRFRAFLDRCLEMLPPDGLVLDLGCGGGVVTVDLARAMRVIGVDLSMEQLLRARRRAPGAAYVHADMTRLPIRDGALDAVAAFWSVIHVPRQDHAGLFAALHRALRNGGHLFGTLGSSDTPDEHGEFFGAPMRWSHFDAETNRRLLREAGFTLVEAEMIEDDGERPLWVLARA